MKWNRIISYLINAAIAIVILQSIYSQLNELTELKSWVLAFGTFLAIYYSCKAAIDDSRSDSK